MNKNNHKDNFTVSAIAHLLASALIGIIGGLIVGWLISWKYSPIAAWDIGASIFLLWTLITIYGSNAEQTERLSTHEDPGTGITDIVLVIASLASLLAVGVIVAEAGQESGAKALMLTGLGILSVAISWFMVHTVYTLRYAREFYKEKGCIDFNSNEPPRYSDFAYLAFTIGVAFQVSDTKIVSNKIRRILTHHSLISYLYGAVIIGVTINLVASIAQ